MRLMKSATLLMAALTLTAGLVYAGSKKDDNETVKLFRQANQDRKSVV